MNTEKLKAVPRHSVDGYGRQDISYNDPEGEFVFYSDYEALKDALEAAEKRIAELEQSEYQLIKERDYAEAALADMYKAATGEAPELSNWFGYADAVDAVEGRIAELEKRVGAAGINLETGGE